MGERASSAIQTAHYIDSAEGTMSDPMHSTPWDEMSVAVLHSVAALLDWSSKQEVRLVCKAWKQAATLAINTLRPNMTGSLGLQWHNLHQLSKAFPACRVLDLRSYRVPSDSAQHMSNTFWTTVLLGNIEANPEPSKSLEELQQYMVSAEKHNPVLSFLVDTYHLPVYSSGSRFTDAECLTMLHYPASAQVVKLHLGCMPVSVTQTGLGYIAQLTTLVELSVTCCEDIDDTHMRLLSALTNLEELRLGPLKGCTSAGLTDGLSALTQLQRLYLMDAIHIKDETIANISCSLSATLRALSMANCPLLTDKCMPYLCLPCLSILFFSNSSFITLQGVQHLVSQSSSLFDLDFRGCTCLSVRDRMQLQQALRSQYYANL
ncbi:TPA: hypothetical protein ACH3X3_001425 [Trebouxia sp. C0006]